MYLAEPAVEVLNFMISTFFAKFYYSLELSDVPNITLRFVFGTMKSRYWASQTPNLSWEVLFLRQFLVPMSDFYTVIFKTLISLEQTKEYCKNVSHLNLHEVNGQKVLISVCRKFHQRPEDVL